MDNDNPPPMARPAADIVIAALRQCGIDPRKAAANPMMQDVVQAWVRGEMDNAGFRRCCENMLIFNPSLALPAAPQTRAAPELPDAAREGE
jgi:hypothetical protein